MEDKPLLLRPPEAAHLLGLSVSSTYALIADGELETVKVGRARRIPLEALQDFVARLRGAEDSDGHNAVPGDTNGVSPGMHLIDTVEPVVEESHVF